MIVFLVWQCTRMIVHDSFSVSCFGNHRPDSGEYFLKCFTVHAEHFVVSGTVLHSQFFHQFLRSAFLSSLTHSLVRPLFHQLSPDSSSVHSSNKSIARKQAVALFCGEKIILLHVCLAGRHLVIAVLREKSLELAPCVTAGELSWTIKNFFCRLTMWVIVGDSWW